MFPRQVSSCWKDVLAQFSNGFVFEVDVATGAGRGLRAPAVFFSGTSIFYVWLWAADEGFSMQVVTLPSVVVICLMNIG